MIFVESLFNMPFSTMATVLMCWVHAPLIFCTKYTTFTIFHLPMWLYQRTRHQASACVWRESIPETSRSSPSSPQVSPQWTSLKSSKNPWTSKMEVSMEFFFVLEEWVVLFQCVLFLLLLDFFVGEPQILLKKHGNMRSCEIRIKWIPLFFWAKRIGV